ncbi:hypothetical protein ABIF34_005307 [Bradyrhizobium japonicum]
MLPALPFAISSRRERHGVEQPPAVARALVEDLAMVLGDSQHVADDGDGQAEGEILDQVHVAAVDHGVDGLVDDLLDPRPHVLDAPRGEGLHHEAAQAGVVGRIGLQHPVAHAAEHRLVHDLFAVAALGPLDEILAEALVAHHEADIGVATGDELAERRHMDRIDRAQPVVMRIGIADEVRRQRIEQRIAAGRLRLLVHGDLKSVAA